MKKMGELFELIDELNADDFAVFGYYFGHVNKISITVHLGGWSPDDEAIEIVARENGNTPEHAMRQLQQIHEEFMKK